MFWWSFHNFSVGENKQVKVPRAHKYNSSYALAVKLNSVVLSKHAMSWDIWRSLRERLKRSKIVCVHFELIFNLNVIFSWSVQWTYIQSPFLSPEQFSISKSYKRISFLTWKKGALWHCSGKNWMMHCCNWLYYENYGTYHSVRPWPYRAIVPNLRF